MCMLTYFPSHSQPDQDALWNGTVFNQDGHGFAIATPRNGMIVRHNMNGDKAIVHFERLRRQYPEGPALFHSRFGTGGVYTRYNCHPFRFGGDRMTVVGHNGILPATVQPGKKDRRCDTRIAAEEVLPTTFGHLSSEKNRNAVAEWIGPSNKLVILTVNPAYDQSAYIINERQGHWDDTGTGPVWYSNNDYLAHKWAKYGKYGYGDYAWDRGDEDPDTGWSASKYAEDLATTGAIVLGTKPRECKGCGPKAIIGKYGDCYVCGICADCGEDAWSSDCECYNVRQRQEEAEATSEWLSFVREQNKEHGAVEGS